MKLQETNHSYHCNDCENSEIYEYETWEEFKGLWLSTNKNKPWIDVDLNLCFRFDILRKCNENDELEEGYELKLFFIWQRMGIFTSVKIKNIENEDIPEIEIFLKMQWDYIKMQWKEIDN